MLRELVSKAHLDVGRELLRSETLTDILASVKPARAAYQRIAERVHQELQSERDPGTTSAAETGITPVPDGTTLTTTQRLWLGLQQRAGRSS